MKYFCIVSLLFLFLIPMSAEPVNGGMGGPVIGGYYMDYSSVNSSLSAVGLELKDMYYQTGGGGYGVLNGILVGGYGYSAQQNLNSSTLNLQYELSGGFFEIGRVWDLKFLAAGLYCKLGTGTERLYLKPVSTPVSFDSLLINPGRTSEITRSGFEGGAGAVLIIPVIKWFNIMVKGGAAYGPAWQWHLSDGTTLLSPPDDKALHYEINIGLMFGLKV